MLFGELAPVAGLEVIPAILLRLVVAGALFESVPRLHFALGAAEHGQIDSRRSLQPKRLGHLHQVELVHVVDLVGVVIKGQVRQRHNSRF